MTQYLADIYSLLHELAVLIAGIYIIAFIGRILMLIIASFNPSFVKSDIPLFFVWSERRALLYILSFAFAAFFSAPLTSFFHMIGYQAPIVEQSTGNYYYYVEIEEFEPTSAVAYIKKATAPPDEGFAFSYELLELIIDNKSYDGMHEEISLTDPNIFWINNELEIHYTLTRQEATVPGRETESGQVSLLYILFVFYGIAVIAYNIYYYSKHPSAEEAG